MSDKAAIAANYSDFKLVKTRSCAQVILEIPLEKAEAFLSLFGVPLPGAERPVALALLNPQKQPEPERPKREGQPKTEGELAVFRSVMLCQDQAFLNWTGTGTEDEAREYILSKCGIASRSALKHNEMGLRKFLALEEHFKRSTGRIAEMRG